MAYNAMMREALRLYRLGFAVHWLHAKSKRPVDMGWATGLRPSWKYLRETYQPGYNLGVRTGTPSCLGGRYLAVIDVDVKSEEKRHQREALEAVRKLVGPGVICPSVVSGRGNGSQHLYCLTEKPFKTWNPAASEEQVKVSMPSKKSPSKREREQLSEEEIARGIRIANAWEISLYSDNRQVVLPPSVHPDSGREYRWKHPLAEVESLPVLDFGTSPGGQEESGWTKDPDGFIRGTCAPAKVDVAPASDFTVVSCPVEWLEISERVKRGILTGEGVTDRSAFLLPAASALVSAGCSRDEVLSVLTDKSTFLGQCAYEHAQTESRRKAALWLWKYTVKRVMEERSAERAFRDVAIVSPVELDEEEAGRQTGEIEATKGWKSKLERTEHGKYKATLHNCKTILMNVCEVPGIVGRNEFAANDFYLCDTPWRSRKGDAVTDIDVDRIKDFCCQYYGIELNDRLIDQVLRIIADKNRFHPVRDWLSSLRWDGVERIDTWLKDYAEAKALEPYLADVSRKVLVAMVKRVFEPGCKFDHVLILEGNQGTGKSTLLRKLADPWFSDATLNIGDKDAILTMQSKWLIELGELSSLGKAEVEQMKAFITQTTDRIRAPYGKRVEEFPRQCIFIGSTNLDEYLKDDTGNRRFWPVKVFGIDYKGLAATRDQLFAEAVQVYRMGEPLWLDNGLSDAQSKLEQTYRTYTDEWLSTVSDIVRGEMFPRGGFEMREVAKKMDQFGAHRLTSWDQQRIGRCLRILGFEKFQETTGDRRRLWRERAELRRTAGTADEPWSKVPPKSENSEANLDFF
jgi:predicted P-loop ATPase